MMRTRKILFLQLPQLDNDTSGGSENLGMAAAYLEHAVRQSAEAGRHTCIRLDPALDRTSTPVLADAIVRHEPDILAATLFLWNIEWTLRLLRTVREHAPGIRFVVGGPEVARSHPFLFRSRIPDVAVAGEGEAVFPAILHALRTGGVTDFSSVATRTPQGYAWGRTTPPPVELAKALPPPTAPALAPDANGMAYMETSRGCPMRCSYCRYAHLRPRVSFLDPEAVVDRVRALQEMGAREIRFIDPTFNAHPRFTEVVRAIAALNRKRGLRFFAELMAERLTTEQARLLAEANFTEIEVGMQSRNPEVLRGIRRPTRLAHLDRGVRRLTRNGIRVTLDLMYALPRQTLAGIRRDIRWSLRQPRINIQCLQTLLLPGTELRERRKQWGLDSIPLPPYAVTATPALTATDLAKVESLIAGQPRLQSDSPTGIFVARHLPGLFTECLDLQANRMPHGPAPGSLNRRTYRLHGPDLFAHRKALADFLARCVRTEPDTLFQFVLVPEAEEPLDLLDELIGTLRNAPRHLVDRYASVRAGNRIASRRIRILLPPRRRFAADWIAAADAALADAFF